MSLRCPKCQQTIEIDGDVPPKELLCSSCGTAFVEATGETVTIVKVGSDETLAYVPVSRSPDTPVGADGAKRFGDYELIEEIARGGMGVVYKARQVSLNRIVALKMIKSGELADETAVRRLRSEAEAAAAIDHPNIVPIYEVGEQDGLDFFSMGYVDGESLQDRINDRPLTPGESVELLKTIADAVQYAHEQGVVHRDLKPGNILIDRVGQPKITDFGLAKQVGADSGMTATGQIMGTPSYMPPEQARGDLPSIGARSDVYALGAVLYALLTGRPPFHAANAMQTLTQVLEREPVSPRQLNPNISRDLDTICLKCLEKDPARRYGSAQDLADDLQRYQTGRPIVARPIARIARLWRLCKRNWIVASLSIGLMLTLLIGFVTVTILWYLAERSSEREAASATKARNSAAEAETAKNAAKRSERQALRNLDRSKRSTFALQLGRAADLARSTPAIALNLLSRCDDSLRDFTWRHLYHACNVERLTIRDNNTAMAIRHDGRQFAVGTRSGRVTVWDSESLRELSRIQGTAGEVVAIDPRFQSFVTSGQQGTFLCDFRTGKQISRVSEHAAHSVRYSRTGKLLVVIERGQNDRPERLFVARLPLKSPPVVLNRGSQRFAAGVLSPDGSLLATRTVQGEVAIWDLSSRNPIWKRQTVTRHDPITCMAFSSDARYFAFGDGTPIRVLDIATKKLRSYPARLASFLSVVFSPDSRLLIGGGLTGPIRVFDRSTGQTAFTLHPDASKGRVQSLEQAAIDIQLFPNGKFMLTRAAGDATVKLWRLDRTGTRANQAESGIEHWCVAWRPKTNLFAVGSPVRGSSNDFPLLTKSGTLKTWNSKTLTLAAEMEDVGSSVTCLAYSADGTLMAAGCGKGTVQIWTTKTGRKHRVLTGHNQLVSSVAFLDSGKTLVVASGDLTRPGTAGSVKFWDLTIGKVTDEIINNSAGVSCLAVSSDQSLIAFGDTAGTVHVRDVKKGKPIATLPGHPGIVWSVAFSPQADRLAVGSGRYLLKKFGEAAVWNLATKKRVAKLEGHTAAVFDVAFSPDGKTVASAGYDTSIRLWDPVTGQQRATLNGHNRWVRAIAFRPDGGLLVSASGDGTVKLWDAEVP